MIIRRITSALLAMSILTNAISPCLAMEQADQPLQRGFLNVKPNPDNTAAGIFQYTLCKGEIYALLGERDDESGAWCNLGGKSDVGDLTLAHTGSRESGEESSGVYCPHPRMLRHLPFIDLLAMKENAPLLYRLYFQQVAYVAPEILLNKAQKSESSHNQEYDDFKWVKVSSILDAVCSHTPVLQEEGIALYGPLFNTLSTKSGKVFLESLATLKKLNPFSSEIRGYCNMVYGGQDIFTTLPYQKAYSFDNQKDDVLAEAVAAYGMAVVQLKNIFEEPAAVTANPSPKWNPHCRETLSRIHLKIVLGPDYQEAADFLSQRQADIANLKHYYALHNDAEYHQKQGKDRKIVLLEPDYETLADVLGYETVNRQWPTGYHGANQGINNLIKANTYLRELLSLSSLKGLAALRGTDLYFRGFKSMADMLEKHDYAENDTTSPAMLFMNYVLTAGIYTSASSSNTVEYFINDHSVQEQSVQHRFEEAMVLAGFFNPVYDYFQSLFEQFYQYKHPTMGNSVLIAVSQNPEDHDANNYAIPSISGSALEVNDKIQKEYEQGKKELFAEDTDRKRRLFPENRFYLEPSRALNVDYTRIKCFDRFPLTREERQAYDKQMRQTTVAFAADWLSQHTSVMDGSFITYPALKGLYSRAYEQVTGQQFKELSPSHDGLLCLISNNYWDAVDTYFKTYPELLDPGVFDVKDFTKRFIQLMEQGENWWTMGKHGAQLTNLKAIKWLLKTFPQCDWKDLAKIQGPNGATLLHIAASTGKERMVKLLIEAGADINCLNNEGETPLFYAIEKFRTEIFELLLSQDGINNTLQVKNGVIPFHDLMNQLQTDLISQIIHHKNFDILSLNPTAVLTKESEKKATLILEFIDNFAGNLLVELILKHPKFNLLQFNPNGFINYQAIVLGQIVTKQVPLLYGCARYGCEDEVLKLILQHPQYDPAGLNYVHPDGTTALSHALFGTNDEIAKMILSHKDCDPNITVSLWDKTKVPLLYGCVKKYNSTSEIIKLILAHPQFDPAQLNYIAPDGTTALSHALSCRNDVIAKVILSHKDCDPNIQDGAYLIEAIKERRPDFVKLIMNHPKFDRLKFNPNVFIKMHFDVIDQVSKKEFHFNYGIVEDRVPLLYRSIRTHCIEEVLKLILEHPQFDPAQLSYVAPDGSTALSIAKAYGKKDIAKMIAEWKV